MGRVVVVKIEAAQLGSPDGIVVGRNPAQAGVVLDHPEASREHFRVTASHGTLSIEDLVEPVSGGVGSGSWSSGCRGEMGRIRPTRVFERAGESRMTPPALSISSQVRPTGRGHG